MMDMTDVTEMRNNTRLAALTMAEAAIMRALDDVSDETERCRIYRQGMLRAIKIVRGLR